jgi:hypothetical protein
MDALPKLDREAYRQQMRAEFERVLNEVAPDRIEVLAFCRPAARVGDFVVVAQACGASQRNYDPWFVSFRGMRLVQITERIDDNPWPKVRVKPVERESSRVPDEQLAQLKSTFATYGERKTRYRENIRNPDFEIELVQSLTKSENILHCLLHHIQMPAARRWYASVQTLAVNTALCIKTCRVRPSTLSSSCPLPEAAKQHSTI